MRHYVNSGDTGRRRQLEHVAQESAGNNPNTSENYPLNSIYVYVCLRITTHLLLW